MSDCKPTHTPLDSGIKFHDIENDKDINNPALPYRALLGSLMYLAQGTRPDIAYAVSALSQFSTRYNKTHWAYAKRILRYLKGSANYGLHYTRSHKHLIGFTDADWGSCTLDRRSYTGAVFLLSNAAISWESRKQRTVALSSTEAEYIALSDAAKEAVYLSKFLSEIGLTSLSRVTIHNDNQGAGKLAMNPVFHSRSKHMDIRCHFIRQALSDHPLELIYTPTDDMIADVLTKALRKGKHVSCIEGFGLKDVRIPRT
ncbi:Copia protein [Trachymyrmex cornetzi]|uniref:Copia protein n=1 Tax=Trachymyrmex cornetzi TaxID=471704 RepID=A0A151JBZ3_9HYME|nr:Copia protein [Trachymyrmex cornetzi]